MVIAKTNGAQSSIEKRNKDGSLRKKPGPKPKITVDSGIRPSEENISESENETVPQNLTRSVG